jgi:hypothetical protein
MCVSTGVLVAGCCIHLGVVALQQIPDSSHGGDVFGPTGLSNAQDPAAVTQTPTGPANAGGARAQPVVTETPFTVDQLQDQPKITTAQPIKTRWYQYYVAKKTTANTAVSVQASFTPSTKKTSPTKKDTKTTLTSASMPVTGLADVSAEVKSWINKLSKKKYPKGDSLLGAQSSKTDCCSMAC